MILEIGGWKFDVDIDRTMEHSASEVAEHCDCAYCRNFYVAIDSSFPKLRPFLSQFGVDIEAPEEMCPFAGNHILYDPTYKVYGRILQSGNFELQSGTVSIVARREAEDSFLLDCYEVFLPWIMDEPFEEVVSPANEPSFLKKMWDRLLGKAKRTQLQ